MVNVYNNYQTAQAVNVPSTKKEEVKKEAPKSTVTNPTVQKFLADRRVKGFYMPLAKTDKTAKTTKTTKTAAVDNNSKTQFVWKNDLRSKFQNNEARICAINIRSFNAKDKDGDDLITGNEERGTYLNAAGRLDELKATGVNTLHILPPFTPGKIKAMGNAGSLYAPASLLEFDPELRDKNDPRDAKEQFKAFVDECHKRDIRVMIDLPSCASVDFYNKPENKKYMAISRNGVAQVPQGWNDIRMFETFKNKDTRELNPDLIQLHKDFIDMCVEVGVDGIRADVGRAKPPEFWDIIIPYSKAKDPEFGWLAENYCYEDASPMLNMDYDRPEETLNAGFDLYYGQFHIFDQWTKGNDLHDYMRENIEMTHRLPKGKGMIGSFATHDDFAPMYQGGDNWCKMTSGLMLTLPMTNPYFVDGFQSGDYYTYKYGNKLRKPAEEVRSLDNAPTYKVHHGWIDIFNTTRRPGGKSPEIGSFFGDTSKVRDQYKDVITKGSYIPLKVGGSKGGENIIAYARHKDGKTLLVVVNRSLNGRRTGNIQVPGLKDTQKMKNLVPSYGEKSKFQPRDNELKVDLGPGRFHMFEIDTPNIEKQAKEVLVPNQV